MNLDWEIPSKTNRVFNLILVGLVLILIRVWYLTIVQREDQIQEAYRPQRRTVVEQAQRGIITDRFGIPLAINATQYNATVCYAPIREIPVSLWEKGKEGKKERRAVRLEYTQSLCQLLARELELDPLQLEDLIHGKAALFPHTPFIVKENITEEQYHRLKMLERDWPGLIAKRSAYRFYPHGKTGADIIGYMGAINEHEYSRLAQEIHTLQTYLEERERGEAPFLPPGFNNPLEVRNKLRTLQERAYTINDLVGKGGIESFFEQELRGAFGKQLYEVDVKGNIQRQLPGSRPPISGQQIQLSISIELQKYAEALLGAYEAQAEKEDSPFSTPWIKGGAIVALDPKTAEVIALASHPRFDPNDFIPHLSPEGRLQRRAHVLRWIENESYIGDIWDGKLPLEREYYSFADERFVQEERPLSWDFYLDLVLAKDCEARHIMRQVHTINDAISLQNGATSQNPDKLLVLDLCRLAVDPSLLPPPLLATIGNDSLADAHTLRQGAQAAQAFLKPLIQTLFHKWDFLLWRKEHLKEFLKQKRLEEKQKKKYERPYTDYLAVEERRQFKQFWADYRWVLLETFLQGKAHAPQEVLDRLTPYLEAIAYQAPKLKHIESLRLRLTTIDPLLYPAYFKSLRPFEDLSRPLIGRYPYLQRGRGNQQEKHLAAAFYPSKGFGYCRSQAYRQSTPQGSVFKLVTAYEALWERYSEGKTDLNPLTIIDEMQGKTLGKTLDGKPITRFYKGGVLPRSHAHVGRVDLLGALEQSSNPYFALLAGEHLSDPTALVTAARQFGFGTRSGIELPGEIGGHLPTDLAHNRTGLYASAIGQHSLVVTPLQTATMLAAIANGGKVLKPRIVQSVQEEAPLTEQPAHFPFQEELSLIGIDFPLFTEAQTPLRCTKQLHKDTEIKHTIPLPESIRQLLVEGMRRAVAGPKGTASPRAIGPMQENPRAKADYLEIYSQLIGKTGTAEIPYKPTLDTETAPEMKNHVWFAAIAYPETVKAYGANADPELVVVVYLRFGNAGKGAAPLAAQIVKKWRTLQKIRPLA